MQGEQWMEDFIKEILNLFSIELAVLITSALPIIELRGAIPLGISLGLSPIQATLISLIGSTVPIPFILFGIRPVFAYLRRIAVFKGIVDKLTYRLLNKRGRVQRYGFWGLMLFVAIPIPSTGVWSGTLLAVLLGMKFRVAFPSLLIGNAIAAVIIMSLSNGLVRAFT
jgi:uncharacterized membrane protein